MMSNIPRGYKQTEVGVIPSDWGVDKIENLTSITTGAKNTQDKIDDGEYLFFVRSKIVERINSYSFDGEAVLTAGDGVGTGKVFHYINGKFDFHQRVYKISDFNKRLDGYFFYLFFSNNFLNRIMQMTAKSSVDSVRMEMIANMQIPIPPLPEQTAIATALSDADALISRLEELIAKKRNIKQGTMQELLTGKKRLPGFSNSNGKSNSYRQTEIGVIPEDWNTVNVNDITINHRQGYYTKDKYVNDGIYLVRITDLLNPRINYIGMPKLNVSVSDFELYKIEKGDFLFARSGAIGRYGIVYEDIKAVFGSYIIRFTFNTAKIINEYFGLLYETELVLKQLMSITQGSSNININANNIKSIKIPLPAIPEQIAIAQILSDMDAEIEQLEQKLDKYRMIKQGMMQQLLIGKIRLL